MMQRIIDKLTELGWTEEALLRHLDVMLRKRDKDRERRRRFLEKNRKQVYEYHRKWRQKNKDE